MRGSYCHVLEVEATFGYNEKNDQTVYGFTVQVGIAWRGDPEGVLS